jgi:iron complex outermembrane receptor protein
MIISGRNLLAGFFIVVVPLVAQAQVEEITVSAQRRDANLQEVPISVSAFKLDDIEKLGMDLTMDIGAAVPNMQSYTVTANAAAMQVYMRGAGIQNPGFNASESPVGLYVDNIYRGRLATASLDLTDVERIEVLRGPQGTLYGRNTIAGAVKIITRTPEEEFWADASVGYGNYETSKITASVGGQIIEGLGGSIAGMYHNRDEGWIDRGSSRTDFFGEPLSAKPLGEFKNKAVRGKLNWFGGDIFGATLSLAYIDAKNDGYNGIPYGPSINPPSSPGEPLQGEGFYDTLVPDSTVGEGGTEQFNAMLDLSWELGAVTLKSITGYSDIDDMFKFDLNGGALQFAEGDPVLRGVPGIYISSDSNNKTISQEFMLQGQAFNDSLDWIAGVFYMNEEGKQLYNPTTMLTGDSIDEHVKTETDSYALYAEGTWNFNQQWALTLGGRWTKDEKKFTDVCVATSVVLAPDTFPACITTAFAFTDWTVDLEEDFTEFNPRALLQYQMNETVMFYGSYSSGFQAGGFQTLCFGFEICSQQIYDPQTADSWELGTKTEFLDRTLRMNAVLFYVDYEDMQQTGILAEGFPLFPVVNVGDASVTGLELELNWSPVENFNTFLIGAYANDDISSGAKENLPPNIDGDKPERLPGLPETTLRVGADWRTNLTSGWDFLVGADVNYVGDYFATINNNLKIDSYTRLNGFIGFDWSDTGLSLMLRGKNLTDEEDNVSGIAGGGTNLRTPLPPREVMLTLNYKFGS